MGLGIPASPVSPGSLQLAQGPAQGFDLLFVGGLLAFRQFRQFQHFLHLLERVLQRLDDLRDLINGLADGAAGESLRLGRGWNFRCDLGDRFN